MTNGGTYYNFQSSTMNVINPMLLCVVFPATSLPCNVSLVEQAVVTNLGLVGLPSLSCTSFPMLEEDFSSDMQREQHI